MLGGIIVDKDYAENELPKAIDDFKLKLFGRKQIILHTADITRNKNGFEKLIETAFRQEFYQELNQLIQNLKFTIVACVVKKDAHLFDMV